MDNKKHYKIALVIKTDGLEYDDRVRKEIASIQKLYPNICFMIFAMLPKNKETRGVTEYGVPYKSIYIKARDKYPSSSMTILKAYQFYKAVREELVKYDAVWVANEDAVFIPMILKHKCILWDLHELPMRFLGSWSMRKLLQYIFYRCKVVLHANSQRVDYLERIGVIKDTKKHIVLRNYPRIDTVNKEQDETFIKFLTWKGNRKCIYLQGLSEERRAAYESVSAVFRCKDMIAVVVGEMHASSLKRLELEYGIDTLYQRVLFIGPIPQLKIPQYVSECTLSLIFYKKVQPNNWYCEANRFYQSVVLGVPVVVGNNPSMKELVEKYGFGVSINDDGSDIEKIVEGVDNVMSHYEEYYKNTIKYKNRLLWDNQEKVIDGVVKRLLDK